MRLLAFCTGSRPWRAGIGDPQGGRWRTFRGEAEGGVGAWLLPHLEPGLGGQPPDALAVERGPGQNAGLRSGLALALGLGEGWDRPVWPLSSFAALAAAAAPAEGSSVVVLIPGPRPLVGAQRWRPGLGQLPLGRARTLRDDQVAEFVRSGDWVCGPGRERWRHLLPAGARTLGAAADQVDPRVLALAASSRWSGQRPPRARDLEPLYLGPPR